MRKTFGFGSFSVCLDREKGFESSIFNPQELPAAGASTIPPPLGGFLFRSLQTEGGDFFCILRFVLHPARSLAKCRTVFSAQCQVETFIVAP